MSSGTDVSRSLWDRAASLLHLDLDYVNFDLPTRAYTDPEHCFETIEPVFRTVSSLFDEFGMPMLATMTGRGYHFTGRLPDDEAVGNELAALGAVEMTLAGKYAAKARRVGEPLEVKGRIYAGIGLLFEYLAHLAMQRCQSDGTVPVTATDFLVRRTAGARASVSLDLSCYGDPLYLRYIRCPFSTHQKYRDPVSTGASAGPALVCLPRVDLALPDLLPIRQSYGLAAELARQVTTVLPITTYGLTRLIREYRASRLRRFHEYFETGWQDEPRQWSSGYDRLDLDGLPACAALPLRYPNDLLLRPSYLRTLALALWSRGWHPKDVAGLIRSKYERDYGWRSLWYAYDAATHANFYVRLFCGLAADGTDDLEDFDCAAYREKGLCQNTSCGHDLSAYAKRLTDRF